MKTLLFNPNLFFSEKLKTEVSFKYPLLIMLVTSLIAIGSSFLIMNKIKESLPSEASSFMLFVILGGVIGALIGTFVYWIILTGIFYLISSVFHSVGSFKRTLEFVSYGFVPQIFSGVVSLFVFYTLLPTLNASSQNPQLFAENLTKMLANNPLSLTAQTFGILCFLVSANIWVFALIHARNMSVKNAIITVGIPVGISLIYQAYLLIGGLT
jgi:hypothetical protein